jgi:hypothetical protein
VVWWKKLLREWWSTLAILAVLAGAFLYLRTAPGPLRTWADLQVHLAGGQPVLVEVYSNT